MQTRRTGQHKAKLTLSPRLHIKPLITVITAIENIQNGLAGCQVTSEKQVLCQSKTQPCMKNAQLRRTLQKLVKIPNANLQGSVSCKIQGF